MCSLFLIGGGGHALSLMEILPGSLSPSGYVDMADVPAMPLRRVGDDDEFLASHPADAQVLITMVSGRSCSLQPRASLIKRYEALPAPVVVAPSATVASSVSIGKGSAIFHKAVVNVGTVIGNHCIVNTGAVVEHGCAIGNNVFIGPGAVVCGGVTIGDNVYIGANAAVRPGVKICADAIIGIGAAVVKNVEQPGTYAGVPARKLS